MVPLWFLLFCERLRMVYSLKSSDPSSRFANYSSYPSEDSKIMITLLISPGPPRKLIGWLVVHVVLQRLFYSTLNGDMSLIIFMVLGEIKNARDSSGYDFACIKDNNKNLIKKYRNWIWRTEGIESRNFFWKWGPNFQTSNRKWILTLKMHLQRKRSVWFLFCWKKK